MREKCKICKEYHWTNEKCNPIFYFKHEDWGDEFQEIRAFNYEDAAEKFAKEYNVDYELVDNETEVIISDGNIEKRFVVSSKLSIDYNVKEIKEE